MAHDHDREPGLWDGTRSAGSAAAGARGHSMFAVTAARFNADDPLAALELGEHADPAPPEGWTTVTVKAASLNHHDLWRLGGVGISACRRPMIIGGAPGGLDGDGGGVVVHSVAGDPAAGGADET